MSDTVCLHSVARSLATAAAMLVLLNGRPLFAQLQQPAASKWSDGGNGADVLDGDDWKRLDRSVDRALEFLARHQNRAGMFEGQSDGQPGITSLCVMAYLSRGHLPDQGPYGERITRAIEFVLATQRKDGLLSYQDPDRNGYAAHSALYNHGIAGLMLCEAFGMTESRQHERIRGSIVEAVKFTRRRQGFFGRPAVDRGGWRYWNESPGGNNSDLSATSWQLMFLRSAKNAEFEVPKEYIDEALDYVKRCFDHRKKAFVYRLATPESNRSVRWGVVGGGIVSLSMGSEHQNELARLAGDWVLAHPFDRYNRSDNAKNRYHYGAYYCSQGMFQLGGKYWAQFYPGLLKTLTENQRPDGSWDREWGRDAEYGNVYTTALSVLALAPAYQILPIYQR